MLWVLTVSVNRRVRVRGVDVTTEVEGAVVGTICQGKGAACGSGKGRERILTVPKGTQCYQPILHR